MFKALLYYDLSPYLKEFKRLEKGHFIANYGFSWLYAICVFKFLLCFKLHFSNSILFKKRSRWKYTEKSRYRINEPNAYSFRIVASLERFKPSVYLHTSFEFKRGLKRVIKRQLWFYYESSWIKR